MSKIDPSNEKEYKNWLSTQISPSKVNDVCIACKQIEKYCLEKKIIDNPLLWITDIKIVKRIKKIVEKSKVFKFFHKNNIEELVESINFFYRYLKQKLYKEDDNIKNYKQQKKKISKDNKYPVLQYMKSIFKAQTLNEIKRELNDIDESKIIEEIKKDKSIILLDEKTQLYMYIFAFPITNEEIDEIRTYLHLKLKKQDFVIDLDLREYIDDNMPHLCKTIASYTRYGWRDCIGYMLQDEFSIRNAIISYKEIYLTSLECYRNLCKTREVISIEELKKLSKALHLNIPFGTVLSECIRINSKTFIRRDLIKFDIAATDKILSKLCKAEYISLKDFDGIEMLPKISVQWNKFVLESYLQEYSINFKLVNLNFSVNSYLGSMVRKESTIKNYEDLAYSVLKKTNQWFDVNTAMEYLVKNKYQANTKFVSIKSIINNIKKERSCNYFIDNEKLDIGIPNHNLQYISNEITKNCIDSSEKKLDEHMVNFKEVTDYSHTKPKKYVYFGNEYDNFTSWRDMYVSIVNVLIEDYDYIIEDLKGKSIGNSTDKIDFIDINSASKLNCPKNISNDMCLETNLSCIDIVKKIKVLLDICLVDYENLKIYYENKKELANIKQIDGEEHSTICKPYQSDNETLFYRWMKEFKGLEEVTCKNYYYYINNIDTFVKEQGLHYDSIHNVKDYEYLYHMEKELLQNDDFLKLNESQHNGLVISLKNYLEFINFEFKSENNDDYKCILQMYHTVLSKNFPRSFRYNSRLDMKKLREYWEKTWGSKLEESDEQINKNIKKITIFYSEGNKEFALVPETILAENNKQDLLDYIENTFRKGKSAIYYNALYEETIYILYDSKINNADMLKEYLKYIAKEKYYFRKSYFSKENNVEIDPIEEIRNYLIAKGIPMKTLEICDELSHIPRRKVKGILHGNKEFIRNSKGVYFHPDIMDVSEKDMESISEIISLEIDKNGFMSENELIEAIKERFPEVLERYHKLTDLGIRDAIGYKLKNKYSFNSKIISEKNKNLSISDIYKMFCKKNSRLTLTALKELKKELNSTIYFDVVYENTLRISEEEFVSKEFAKFNVAEIDKVIDNFCIGEYIAIQDIQYFSSFPELRFPWNSYLLEHYVADYSQKYKLLHTSFNESRCVGAIVKATSDIKSFYELVVDVLSNSNIVLDTDTALEYLCNRGFLGRRSYKDINKAIIEVNVIRKQKG